MWHFCLIGKHRRNFLVPRMNEMAPQDFHVYSNPRSTQSALLAFMKKRNLLIAQFVILVLQLQLIWKDMFLLFMKEKKNQRMNFVINAFTSVRLVAISNYLNLEKHGSSVHGGNNQFEFKVWTCIIGCNKGSMYQQLPCIIFICYTLVCLNYETVSGSLKSTNITILLFPQ